MADKLREISDSELETILAEHKKWLETDGGEGKKADLSRANLQGRDLKGTNLEKADLGGADLREAKLWRADLTGAIFTWFKLWGLKIQTADLRGAELCDASLRGANLKGANLKCADLRGADFSDADVTGVKYNRWGRYKGIRVATCHGSARFKNFAQHEAFIEELKEIKEQTFIKELKEIVLKPFIKELKECRKIDTWLYYLWHIFADCGRTPWSWILWSIILALFFGVVFAGMGPEHFAIKDGGLPHSLGTMIYYSVVTFTTLGFGDVTPKTAIATYFVMAEVILGYIMLGGLISIFATLLTRRS